MNPQCTFGNTNLRLEECEICQSVRGAPAPVVEDEAPPDGNDQAAVADEAVAVQEDIGAGVEGDQHRLEPIEGQNMDNPFDGHLQNGLADHPPEAPQEDQPQEAAADLELQGAHSGHQENEGVDQRPEEAGAG